MTTALLTPYAHGDAIELGHRVYRKQILKAGPITYAGRVVNFTRDYLHDLVANFRAGVLDQVPFQLADAGNRHTNDPERTRGVVKGLELTDDGLDAIVELTDDGARVVEQNPQLGVSARILEDVQYADGRSAGRVLQHVLGTLDPHLAGLRPWQAVTLSNHSDATVVDLTAATYETEEPEMATALSEEEITRLRALLGTINQSTGDGNPASPAAEPTATSTSATATDSDSAGSGDLDDISDEDLTAELAAAGIDDLDAFLTALTDDTDDGENDDGDGDGDRTDDTAASDAGDRQPAAAALANDQQQMTLELSQAHADQTAIELARVRDELDEATYARERDQIVRDSGLPPRVVDLAKPLLKGTGHTVSLAPGDEVDAGQVVRQIFGEVGKLIKVLDLSGELGHAVDLTRSNEEKAADEERQTWVQAVRGKYDL